MTYIPKAGLTWEEIKSKLESEGALNPKYEEDIISRQKTTNKIIYYSIISNLLKGEVIRVFIMKDYGRILFDNCSDIDLSSFATLDVSGNPENKYDGKYDTSSYCTTSGVNAQWDLGEEVTYYIFADHEGRSYVNPDYNSYSYIEISSDGSTWTTISSCAPSAGSNTIVRKQVFGQYTFRYIRWRYGGASTNYGAVKLYNIGIITSLEFEPEKKYVSDTDYKNVTVLVLGSGNEVLVDGKVLRYVRKG